MASLVTARVATCVTSCWITTCRPNVLSALNGSGLMTTRSPCGWPSSSLRSEAVTAATCLSSPAVGSRAAASCGGRGHQDDDPLPPVAPDRGDPGHRAVDEGTRLGHQRAAARVTECERVLGGHDGHGAEVPEVAGRAAAGALQIGVGGDVPAVGPPDERQVLPLDGRALVVAGERVAQLHFGGPDPVAVPPGRLGRQLDGEVRAGGVGPATDRHVREVVEDRGLAGAEVRRPGIDAGQERVPIPALHRRRAPHQQRRDGGLVLAGQPGAGGVDGDQRAPAAGSTGNATRRRPARSRRR